MENSSDKMDEECEEEVDDNGGIANLPGLGTIWDCKKILLLTSPSGRISWKCGWCGSMFHNRNATKAVAHLVRAKREDIKICKGKIRQEYMERYVHLRTKYQAKRKASALNRTFVSNHIKQEQGQLVSAITTKKMKHHHDVTGANTTTNYFNNTKKNKFFQTTISGKDESSSLRVAIADMIHSLGLPFGFAEDPKFLRVVRLAKFVPINYNPPSRKAVSSELLELNYTMAKNNELKLLKTDSDIFGIALFGDGATVAKLPLFNILASGAYKAASCRQIVSCAKQMAKEGGKKDAGYIADLCKPHIDELGEVDLVAFDGASNVQKAGDILHSSYPRITCIHGIEHCTSLFFKDCSEIPVLRTIIIFYKAIYSYFGSGARHATYAIFMQFAKDNNKGRKVGLIRAADTRMGGYYIALLRLLCLKTTLLQTVVSPSWLELNLRKAKELVSIIKNDMFWEMIVRLMVPFYPALQILRLADSTEFAMDKVFFCVRRTEAMIENNSQKLDEFNNSFQYKRLLTRMAKFNNSKSTIEMIAELENDEDEIEIEGNGEQNTESAMDEIDDDNNTTGNLSEIILKLWRKRAKTIINPYAVTAWMLSPVPEVMDDAIRNHNGDHRSIVSDLVVKLLLPFEEFNGTAEEYNNKKCEILDEFWDEHNSYTTKTNQFANLDYIWRSADLNNNCSHLWHKKNSLRSTNYLGKVACLVSSKPLGIGSAERCWGEVKELMGGQRMNLTSEKISALTTIQGRYCAEKSYMRKQSKVSTNNASGREHQFWDERDMEVLGLNKYGLQLDVITGKVKAMRVFRAWFEDWEKDIISKNDPVVEQKFLAKYGGLSFMDLDKQVDGVITIDKDEMYWRRDRGEKQWEIRGLNEGYNAETNNDDWDAWRFQRDEDSEDEQGIYDCIIQYYNQNPDPFLNIVNNDT